MAKCNQMTPLPFEGSKHEWDRQRDIQTHIQTDATKLILTGTFAGG